MALSRRRFLGGILGASGALVACRAAGPREQPTPVATPPKLLAIDMHNHVYPAGTEPHPHGVGGPPPPNNPPLGLADALTHSGFTAVCASFVLDFTEGDFYANLTHWLDAIDAQLAAGHLRRALSAADLHAGSPTIIQSVEGSMFIAGKLERVDEVYRRGMRHLQLLHEHDDAVAPLGDVNTGEPHLGGLTAIGADVIRACNRLGMLVDLAHASHDTVLGALRVATKPLIVSHTSLAGRPSGDARMAEMMRPRLITAEHAKVVADAGGVVGVWTHLASSLPDFVESIAAMVDAIGIDHVGIGTDMDLLTPKRDWTDARPSFVAATVAELQRHGFHDDEVAKLVGRNYLRVFAAAVG
ncbi:MAG TPA: membrane dipeptidase [Kofleriaceae bacterium]|jgi:membrane dipeptidase